MVGVTVFSRSTELSADVAPPPAATCREGGVVPGRSARIPFGNLQPLYLCGGNIWAFGKEGKAKEGRTADVPRYPELIDFPTKGGGGGGEKPRRETLPVSRFRAQLSFRRS